MPIPIGPFTNVPAPGDPIRSDWPQQAAQVITNLTDVGIYTATLSIVAGTSVPAGGVFLTGTVVVPTKSYKQALNVSWTTMITATAIVDFYLYAPGSVVIRRLRTTGPVGATGATFSHTATYVQAAGASGNQYAVQVRSPDSVGTISLLGGAEFNALEIYAVPDLT